MKKMNLLVFTICCISLSGSVYAQQKENFKFTKLVYHASRCNGSCPQISLIIERNRKIVVRREMFKTKSQADERYSGQFKGRLSPAIFNEIILQLKAAQLDSLKFPDVDCCDGSIKTLIVYYNGQRRYFKSMMPPETVQPLFEMLSSIAIDKKLKRTAVTKDIEE